MNNNKLTFINRNNMALDLAFCVFLFVSSGFGHYYNELYQISNTLVIADFALLILMLIYFFKNFTLYIKKTSLIIIIIFIYMLMLGLVSNNKFSYILRDVKVFIYFFIPYIYLKKIENDKIAIKKIIVTLYLMTIFAIIVCSYDFFSNGVNGISSGKILRTFSLGISQYGLTIMFVFSLSIKEIFVKKFNIFIYYIFQGTCLFLIIVSFTRSVWIQFITSIVLYYILKTIYIKSVIIKKKKIIKYVLEITSLLLCIYFILKYVNVHYSNVLQILSARFDSISGNQVGNNVNTLEHRYNNVLNYRYKFTNIRILIGYGFGDVAKGDSSPISENSFVYYAWKYGIILNSYLILKVLKEIKKIISRKSNINSAIAASLMAYFISGGISGHLNKYYMLPFVATLLLVNFDKIIDYK